MFDALTAALRCARRTSVKNARYRSNGPSALSAAARSSRSLPIVTDVADAAASQGGRRSRVAKPKDHAVSVFTALRQQQSSRRVTLARRNDRDRDITALVQIATLCDLSSCGGDAGSRLTDEAA